MKMSDFDNISKAIQKKFFRTKEKVLETLGKADKTKDGDFDSLANTFHEQHATANKLLRAFRNYSAQVKAMSLASKNMHQAVSDAYEPNWDGAENFVVQTEQLNKIWDDHFAKVSETIQFHIVSYVSKFPELKNKIAKRGRKLLDYDRARHKLDALEKSKKRDEYKITTATRELNAAQTIYETINNELFEELPVLYNSRIPLLSNYFSLFLRTEAAFEDDLTKIKRQMAELTAGLLKEQNLIASKSNIGTLRAKTLPRREPPKMTAPVEKKGRYSPQLGGPRANESRNLNKGATLPPKPPSPKFSSFSYQPPPPQEPAPLPPPTSPVYSTIGQSKSQSSPPPQKPPQPQFGYISPQISPLQNSAQINPQTSSSSPLPPPIPPPPSAFINHEVSRSSSPPLNQNQEPGNPFESDLKEDPERAKKDLSKGITNVSSGLSDGLKEVEKKVVDVGKQVVDGGAHVAVKVQEGVAKCAEGVAKGVEGVAKGGAQVTSQVINAGHNIATKTSEKTEAVVNDISKKSEAGVEKVKEVAGDTGKTITENIDMASDKVASNRVFGGVVGLMGSKVEVKVGETGEIILPSNRYLYKVQATHSYLASDTDEMTLDSGDVIYVLPIDNKEFEDEGWALGLKQKNGSRGMFPVNFTRRIDQ